MNLNLSAKRASRLAIIAILGAGLAASAKAETLLIDFGNAASFRGVTVPNPDPKGHFWNSLAPGNFYAAGSLVDINNAATVVQLGFDTGVGTDSFNGPAGVTSAPPTAAQIAATDIDTVALGNLGVKEAAIDFAASPGGLNNNTRFQLQGLDPAKKYTITLFGSHIFSDDDNTVYSAFNNAGYSSLLASASLAVQHHNSTDGAANLPNRDTVATLSNLSPASNGILYMQFVGANGNQGYLNSFQIAGSAVPEPTSLLLLSSGLALVFGYRRR